MSRLEKFNLAWAPVMTGVGIFDAVERYTVAAIIATSCLGVCLVSQVWIAATWRKLYWRRGGTR